MSFPLVYPISPFAYYFLHTFPPILVVCSFLVFLLFHVRRLVFYFAGTSQTLTPPFCCAFIQVGFHLKPPHLHIFMISVFSLFTPCTFSLIFTHFYSTHYTIHLLFISMCSGIHIWFSLFLFHFYQAVCVSTFPWSTYPVYYFLFILPIICLHHYFGLCSLFSLH